MKNKYFALAVIMLLAFACKNKTTEITKQEPIVDTTEMPQTVELSPDQVKTAGVVAEVISKKNLRQALKVNGYLKLPPQNEAKVFTLLSGTVQDIFVTEGNYVKKGQTLATLANPDFIRLQQEYLTARNTLKFKELEYQRQKSLQEQNINAAKTFQQTEADYLSEKTLANALSGQLNLLGVAPEKLNENLISGTLAIKSPIDGYVGHISINLGEYVGTEKELMNITDNNKLHLDLFVYEKDIAKIKTGQKVDFVLTNVAASSIEAVIFSIGKTFEDDTKAIIVHAEILTKERSGLIPGMFVNAVINAGENNVPCLPDEAIVRNEGKKFIFIKTDRTDKADNNVIFDIAEVTTGVSDRGFTEVYPVKSLPADAKIVVKGSFYLISQLTSGAGAGCADEM